MNRTTGRAGFALGLTALVSLLIGQAVGISPADPGFRRVGEDPLGDAHTYLAGPAEPPSPTAYTQQFDLVALDIAQDEPTFHLRTILASRNENTTGLLVVAHFAMNGQPFYVCWNVQSAYDTMEHQEVEDPDSCSLFASETLAGPTTIEEGVQVGTNADGTRFVQWPVNKASHGGPGLIGIQNISVETWARGIDVQQAPPAARDWTLADRAPDQGTWNHSLTGEPLVLAAPPPTPSRMVLEAPQTHARMIAGETLTLPLSVSIDQGQAEVHFLLWNAGQLRAYVEPSILNLTAASPRGFANLSVQAGPHDGQTTLQLEAIAERLQASQEFTIQVEAPEPSPEAEVPEDRTTDARGGSAAAFDYGQDAGSRETPAALFVAALSAVLAPALRRRRRDRQA